MSALATTSGRVDLLLVLLARWAPSGTRIAADDAGGTIAGADGVAEREGAYATLGGAAGASSIGFFPASSSSQQVIRKRYFKTVTGCGLALTDMKTYLVRGLFSPGGGLWCGVCTLSVWPCLRASICGVHLCI